MALLRFVVGMIIIESICTRQLGSDMNVSESDVAPVGKNQQALLMEWAKSLKPKVDYNGTYAWRWRFRSNAAEDYFNGYNEKFSEVAENLSASVNFVSIGACDGTEDHTIQHLFLGHSHWKGVFVEPISFNFADLTNFLAVNGVANRSTAIRGAATSVCTSPFLELKRPPAEERDKSSPHWVRREVGSVIRSGQKIDKGYIIEKVHMNAA